MIKHTLLAILFFAFSFAFSQEVSITNNLPTSAAAGEAIDAQYTLTKGATMGSFAKFQLDLPAGFQAQSTEIKGGNFTFENNRVKIVWVSLPGDASFNFTFKLTPASSVSGNVNFAPQFFYLENSVKKEYNPTPVVINFGGSSSSVASDNTSTTTQPVTTTTSDNATPATTDNSTPTDNTSSSNTDNTTTTVAVQSTDNNTSNTSNTTSQPATASNPTTAETVKTSSTTTTPVAAKSNVVYHVQLAALTNKPTKSKFAEYGPVKIVEDAGLYKVLVGTFKTLEEARKYKAQLIAKGTVGCFVVAYENGARVKIN